MNLGERMARIETLVEGLIEHNRVFHKWLLTLLGGLALGVVLIGLPGCVRLLGGGG